MAFVMIPKAASTSILSLFAQQLGVHYPQGVQPYDALRAHLMPVKAFMARGYRPGWFVFTVVRDPTLRAHSAWKNKVQEAETLFAPARRMGMASGMSFEQFLTVLHRWPQWALNDHFMPQTNLLGPALELPDLFVARMETLGPDWERIRRKGRDLGIDLPALPVLNRTSPAPPPDMGHQERSLLRALYHADYSRFGYALP